MKSSSPQTLTKKQRKSSRIYNDVLRHMHTGRERMNAMNIHRNKWTKSALDMRTLLKAPALSVPPISIMKRREEAPQKSSVLGWLKNLFRRNA